MRVCDKCKIRKVEKIIKIEGREVELCSECYYKILKWLEEPEKKGFLNMFGGTN